jgi:hypothetical protein
MATLRFTFNPYSIANEILPNTANTYRAGIQPIRRNSSINNEELMQALVILICSILALEVRFELKFPADHQNRNFNQKC